MIPITILTVITETVSGGDAVIQVAEETTQAIDYTETLVIVNENLTNLTQELMMANGFLQYIAGFALFGVIVLICFFGYKFLKMLF